MSCKQKIGLSKIGCPNNYHFSCAISKGCLFLKDKVGVCSVLRMSKKDFAIGYKVH